MRRSKTSKKYRKVVQNQGFRWTRKVMNIYPKRTLKMDPKSMPKPTKGGQGPPQGAPGGDFDSFWSASRTSRGPKKGVRKMDRKMDPQKIDFWRILKRDTGRPGGVCGWHLGFFLFGTPCTPEGAADQVQSLRALRQAREEVFQTKSKVH